MKLQFDTDAATGLLGDTPASGWTVFQAAHENSKANNIYSQPQYVLRKDDPNETVPQVEGPIPPLVFCFEGPGAEAL